MEYMKLNDVCSIITDGTHQTPTYSESGYIFLSSKNVTNRKIDWENVKYIPEELHQQLYQRLAPQKNDILLAKNGTTGVAALVDRDDIFDIYVSLALLRPKEIVYPPYLLHAINSPYAKRQFNKSLKGIGVPNLHLKEIRETQIPVPDLDTQKNIVKILDKAQKLIDKRKEQVEACDELIKSQFIEMFGDPITNPKGWKQTALKEVAIGKLTYGSGASAVDYDGECRYVRITDITSTGDLNNDIKSPSEVDEKYLLNDGDILFARSGATVGKTLQYKEAHGKCLYAGYLIRLVPNREIVIPEYVFNYTKTDYYTKFIESNMKVVAQPNINAQQYGDLVICIPPIELQNEFAQFVQQVDKLKFKMEQSLVELENNFNALMQRAFKGELF